VDTLVKWRLWIIFFLFCVAFVVIVTSIFHEFRHIALNQAENNLSAYLLNHRATRNYIEFTQKPEIYRLKKNGQLYEEYFSPKVLSSTYIARHINELQNEDRRKAGLEEIYFKFASPNPRNPVNQANSAELELLASFNKGTLQKYKGVTHIGSETFLYFALPIDRNSAICMKCHGNPADAPQEMIDLYGDTAGFNEKLGEMRALMSVRIPANQLLATANRTASILSAITFILLSGAFLAVHLLFREVEKQKKIALNNSYYLNSVLQSSSDTAIFATDVDLIIRYCNRATESIFGLPANEILGRNILDVAAAIGLPTTSHAEKAIDTVNQYGSFRFAFKLNQRTLEAQISSISGANNDHTGFLFMGQDITERISKEKEREEIKNRLAKAEKVEAIGILAGGVAHDLNNILSGIISYPELLLMKLPEDSAIRPTIEAIQKSGQRAAAVVADLLMVARGIASKKEVGDLNLLVDEYLHSPEFETLQQHHSAITTAELTDEHMPVYCSSIHLKKCIMNLVGNSLEAMEGGGYCRVSTGKCKLDSETARKLLIEPGDYCFIRVTDDGPGIDPEDLQHIFEPFYSNKKMGRSGTGLGLSVVWNTMKDHDGAVEVKSDSRGSAFTLYFPLCLDQANSDKIDMKADILLGKGEKILVVDDDPQLIDIAHKMLTEINYEVAVAGSGEEAIRFLEENNVDLVLIDMIMPMGMNGRETYQEILTLRPGQKAMIVSGFSETDEVKAALAMGAKGLISKPYSLEQLGRMVKAALQD